MFYLKPIQIIDYTLETPAASEPITLAEAKTHLRIDTTDYDSIITPLISTVRQYGEAITGRDFINKTYKGYLDQFPCDGIEIRKSKLQSITSIKYYINSILTTLNSANYYFTKADNAFSKIYLVDGQDYPTTDSKKQAIEILFVVGYGATAASVPEGLKQAMLSHLTALFNNTGDCVNSDQSQFKSLYYPYILADKFITVL